MSLVLVSLLRGSGLALWLTAVTDFSCCLSQPGCHELLLSPLLPLSSPCHVPCCAPASTPLAPIQKQLLRGKSTQNSECNSGEVDVEKQSEDCWLGASSPTLPRRKWHFSASQNSMTTCECPNGTLRRYDRSFSFVTGNISIGAESCQYLARSQGKSWGICGDRRLP